MINLLFAGLLAAAAPDSVHPQWMVGTWGWRNPGERGSDCGGDHSITYHRDGRYDFMDETGYWRVVGNHLIETMTDPGGTGDPELRGKPQILRFTRTQRGVLRIAPPRPGTMFKCRAS